MSYQADDRIDSFFAHHGIKGQKWGVRRFETENGMLTEEGKKRYAKYNDGRYDDGSSKDKKSSSGKPKLRTSGSSNEKNKQLLAKRVKANKYRNADGTLTEEGKKKFNKYAKEMGYGGQNDSVFRAKTRAFTGRLASKMIQSYGIKNMISGAAGLSAMAKSKSPIDSSEVRKKEIAFFGGAGLAAVSAVQQHMANKRRNYIIKYADAYGNARAKQAKEQAKQARRTARATGLAITGAEIFSSLSGRFSSGSNSSNPGKSSLLALPFKKG